MFLSYIKLITCILLYSRFACAVKGGKETKEALEHVHQILKNGDYDPLVRPFLNNGTVNITLQLSIIALGPVNDQSFTFRVDYFMRAWWVDDRLKFPSGGEVTLIGNPKGKFWLPDLYVMNSREVRPHSLGQTYRTTIHSDGTVYWSTRISEISSCKMDLRNFPMDEQNCKMVFESYAYDKSSLRMNWHKTPVEEGRGHLSLNGYVVEAITAEKEEVTFVAGEEIEHLEVTFKLHRVLSNYISRLYIPSTFLVVMTWGTFWLPPSTYPARVAIIVTNFLASVFILRGGSSYTDVPYLTALEIFFVINVTFILVCMFEYIVTIHLNLLKEKAKKLKMKKRDLEMKPLNEVEHKTNGVNVKKDKEKKTKNEVPITDRISRYAFPLTYLIFMIIYFSYFQTRYHY